MYRKKARTHCAQLAFQQARSAARLFCWTIGVDADHFSRHFQGRVQAPEKSIRFGHFMIHVDHEHAVKAVFRQHRIVTRDEHTSELQSLMSTPYAVSCLKKHNPHTTKDI